MIDTALIESRGIRLLEAASALIEAGARLLQFRHKGPYSREILSAALSIQAVCKEAGATLIVNDRADIALLADAGLHVGQDDLPPVEARRLIGPGRILGFSTHNESQLIAAAREPVDYVAIGPIFATSSKSNPDPVVGVEGLKRLRVLTERPVVAIGGITLQAAPAVIAAGADSVAVIGDLYRDAVNARSVRNRAARWIAALGQVSKT